MYPPVDPVENIINGTHHLALTLMNETFIVNDGMNTPNQIVTSEVVFESLDSEPDPNKLRGIAKAVEILIWQQFVKCVLFKPGLRRPRQRLHRMTYRHST